MIEVNEQSYGVVSQVSDGTPVLSNIFQEAAVCKKPPTKMHHGIFGLDICNCSSRLRGM